jgi:hypothetical protein
MGFSTKMHRMKSGVYMATHEANQRTRADMIDKIPFMDCWLFVKDPGTPETGVLWDVYRVRVGSGAEHVDCVNSLAEAKAYASKHCGGPQRVRHKDGVGERRKNTQ